MTRLNITPAPMRLPDASIDPRSVGAPPGAELARAGQQVSQAAFQFGVAKQRAAETRTALAETEHMERTLADLETEAEGWDPATATGDFRARVQTDLQQRIDGIESERVRATLSERLTRLSIAAESRVDRSATGRLVADGQAALLNSTRAIRESLPRLTQPERQAKVAEVESMYLEAAEAGFITPIQANAGIESFRGETERMLEDAADAEVMRGQADLADARNSAVKAGNDEAVLRADAEYRKLVTDQVDRGLRTEAEGEKLLQAWDRTRADEEFNYDLATDPVATIVMLKDPTYLPHATEAQRTAMTKAAHDEVRRRTGRDLTAKQAESAVRADAYTGHTTEMFLDPTSPPTADAVGSLRAKIAEDETLTEASRRTLIAQLDSRWQNLGYSEFELRIARAQTMDDLPSDHEIDQAADQGRISRGQQASLAQILDGQRAQAGRLEGAVTQVLGAIQTGGRVESESELVKTATTQIAGDMIGTMTEEGVPAAQQIQTLVETFAPSGLIPPQVLDPVVQTLGAAGEVSDESVSASMGVLNTILETSPFAYKKVPGDIRDLHEVYRQIQQATVPPAQTLAEAKEMLHPSDPRAVLTKDQQTTLREGSDKAFEEAVDDMGLLGGFLFFGGRSVDEAVLENVVPRAARAAFTSSVSRASRDGLPPKAAYARAARELRDSWGPTGMFRDGQVLRERGMEQMFGMSTPDLQTDFAWQFGVDWRDGRLDLSALPAGAQRVTVGNLRSADDSLIIQKAGAWLENSVEFPIYRQADRNGLPVYHPHYIVRDADGNRVGLEPIMMQDAEGNVGPYLFQPDSRHGYTGRQRHAEAEEALRVRTRTGMQGLRRLGMQMP